MVRKFEVQEVAMEMAAQLRPSLEALARHDADLARQVRRAAASVVLNIAEGAERRGKDRLHHYRVIAHFLCATLRAVARAGGPPLLLRPRGGQRGGDALRIAAGAAVGIPRWAVRGRGRGAD